jgi:phosphoglycolate phosphatase
MASEKVESPYFQPLLGIVFDLDGTLVNSQHDFIRMRREVVRIAEKYGVPPGVLKVTDNIPHILEQAHAELETNHIPEGYVFRMEIEVDQTINAIELEALPRTVARPGAPELLQALADKGYRLGVLTRSSEQFCRAALQKTSLGGFFPYLRTRSAPGPAKPSPEALHALLHEMGVPLERAAYIGDHPIDAECARRARVRFLAILPDGETPADETLTDKFRANGATAVARTLPDLGKDLGVRVAAPKPPAETAAPPPAN